MGFRIIWTEPALCDLEGLVRFIAQDDKQAAIRVGDEIVDHVAILETFPEIGPIYRQRPGGTIRQITCRPFRIFYRVYHEDHCVQIIHVWHGARQDPGNMV